MKFSVRRTSEDPAGSNTTKNTLSGRNESVHVKSSCNCTAMIATLDYSDKRVGITSTLLVLSH